MRHARFWGNVSEALQENMHFYTAQQCENKVTSLCAVYKDLIGDAGTGSEGLILKIRDENLRNLMALVHQLIGDSVSVKPLITFNVGLKSVCQTSDTVSYFNPKLISA